jgi:hypothetical protein
LPEEDHQRHESTENKRAASTEGIMSLLFSQKNNLAAKGREVNMA